MTENISYCREKAACWLEEKWKVYKNMHYCWIYMSAQYITGTLLTFNAQHEGIKSSRSNPPWELWLIFVSRWLNLNRSRKGWRFIMTHCSSHLLFPFLFYHFHGPKLIQININNSISSLHGVYKYTTQTRYRIIPLCFYSRERLFVVQFCHITQKTALYELGKRKLNSILLWVWR